MLYQYKLLPDSSESIFMITESVGVMTGDVVIVGTEIGMLMIGDDKLNQSILSLYRLHMIANN